jgi:long-chain acyl-CoA synthetase
MCNRVSNNKIGTIGLPFKGVEVKIAPDDELLIKAPSAFKGYHHDSELTKEVFKNGWLATGDLAKVDNEGFIKLVGRKKDIIVTAGGKNVTPAPLEQIVQSNSLVSQCVVIGDKKAFISALITLDMGGVNVWAKKHRIKELTQRSASKNKAIAAQIQRTIDEANEAVSRAESIRKFIILPEDFSIENGCLTASSKIIRSKILTRYDSEINNEIYKK